jgi:hypothetical protein
MRIVNDELHLIFAKNVKFGVVDVKLYVVDVKFDVVPRETLGCRREIWRYST